LVDKERDTKGMIDRFKLHVETSCPSIFSRVTREKLLGSKRIWGGKGDEATRNTFWYRTRNQVRAGLKDLHLFLESADRKNINKVVTVEALRPIVHDLLYRPLVYEEEPDRERAQLARWFIEMGFEYLKQNSIRLPQIERGIDDALKLTTFLAGHLEEVKGK